MVSRKDNGLNGEFARRAMLIAAATAARRADLAADLAADLDRVDWDNLERTLRGRHLLATLGPRLLEAAGGDATPAFAAAVEDALVTGHRRGMFLRLVSERATSALAEAGIRSAPLKGPDLAESLYGDPGRRFSNDIDLLVAPEQLSAAAIALQALEYHPPQDHIEANGLPLLHLSLSHVREELPPIELHWRIHWYEDEFAHDRLLPSTGDSAAWRPEPIDEFAALLLFYARDGFVDIRLAADLAAWWDFFGDAVGSREMGKFLAAYPAFARVVPAALCAAERTVGLPAERVLPQAMRLNRRQRAAVRLANPNPVSSKAQLFAEIGLIDGLLAPPGGFGPFVRRNVLPHREVLEIHAAAANRDQPRSAAGRAFGIVARYALAMTRLARSEPDGLVTTSTPTVPSERGS